MAPQSLRIVRRPRDGVEAVHAQSLVAASQPIPNAAKAFKNNMSSSVRNDWQNDAWTMLDAVGELRYYVGWRASSASRVRLIASEIDANTGLPTGGLTEDDDGNLSGEQLRVAEIVRSIAGGPLGQAQLIKRAVEHLTIPGETHIAILFLDPPDPVTGKAALPTWLALSREEWRSSARETKIDLPNGTTHTFAEGVDGMFRVWNPRPRKAKEADSPVRAAMDSLREIVRTTKTIANASKSRLIGNGVVFVPHEMSLPTMGAPVSADKPGIPLAPLQGSPAVQQLQELLFQVAQTAYDDEDSMAALIPMFAGVPGDLIKQVNHLKFDNTVTEVALKTRNEAIGRLAMALDVSPERLMGLGSNSNHWSAWQVADEDVQLHIVPPVETLCSAITDQVFKTVLAREKIDPTKYVLHYDVSALTADPDPAESAKDAFDRGAITAEALVRMLGLADDTVYDFSTPEGWEQWATDKASQDPTLLPILQPLITQLAAIEFPTPQAALPPGQEDQQGDNGDGTDAPDTEDDADQEDSVQASARLNDRESAVVELMVARAMELAGKRMRTRSLPAELRRLPERELVRRLDPVRTEQVPELVRGWDSVLDEPAIQNLGLNAAAVRAAVRKIITQELTRTIDGEVTNGVA